MPIGLAGVGSFLTSGGGAGLGSAVSGIGSLVGGLFGSSASSQAASDQKAASYAALASQNAQWSYDAGLQLPYIQNGDNAQTNQNALMGTYDQTVTPSLNNLLTLGNSATAQSALEQTPGYQFTLSQGLKSTQNAAAARGLGVSGAALKGAASYSTGLADSTYQQQFNNALSGYQAASSNFQNRYGDLGTQATLGGSVAVQSGSQGQEASTNSSNLLTGAGNAQASGVIGSANALTSGFAGAGNALTGYQQSQMLNQYLSNSGTTYGANGVKNLDDAVAG